MIRLLLNGKQSAKKIVALACLLCFVTTVMLSGALASSHTGHSHDHEHHDHSHGPGRECTGADDSCYKTCAHLCKADTAVKSAGAAAGGAWLGSDALFGAASLFYTASCWYLSPVALRIRANC